MTRSEAARQWQQAALHHDRCKRAFLASTDRDREHAAARCASASRALTQAAYEYEVAEREAVVR